MKINSYLTAYPVLSHTMIAIIAVVTCWLWFGTHKELAMKIEEKKFKIALMLPQNIYYHENAAKAFIETIQSNANFSQLYSVKRYNVSSLDSLILRQMSQKILDDNPDIIVPIGAAVSNAIVSLARARGAKIPIVFIGVSQADKMGLVDSLENPGGNVTGLATVGEDSMIAFDILRYVKPTLKKLLLPYDALSVGGVSERNAKKVVEHLKQFNISVSLLPINVISEVIERVNSLLDQHDTISYLEGDRVGDAFVGLIRLCNKHQKTLFALELETSAEGGAIAYGVDPSIIGENAFDYVDMVIQKKKNPAEMPVRLLSDSRRLVINKKALKEQGLSIDPMLMALIEKSSVYKGSSSEALSNSHSTGR